jgi:drug/metabolite transporter (DMT)-like permease
MKVTLSATLGILAGLTTAGLWAGTAICFEVASRRLGSLLVNILRLVLAALLFIGLSFLRFGSPIFPGLTLPASVYLSLSGLVGFVLGDLFLFQAFVLIGARHSMVIYSSVPFVAAILGWTFLQEKIGLRQASGMIVTVAGIALAITGKSSSSDVLSTNNHELQRRRQLGILLAVGASIAQAVGLLLAKHGAQGIDSFSATEIRVLAGLIGFFIVAVLFQQTDKMAIVFKRIYSNFNAMGLVKHPDRVALGLLTLGAIMGPFLGVSLGLLSTQLLPTGIASTLMSLVPIILIPMSALIFHEPIRRMEVIGACLAVLGVALLAF